jgi:hypothetical protein
MADPYDPAHALGVIVAWACRQGTVETPVRHQLALLRRGLKLHDTPYFTEAEDAIRTAELHLHLTRARRAAEAHVIQLLAGMTGPALDDALAMLEHVNPEGFARLRAHLDGRDEAAVRQAGRDAADRDAAEQAELDRNGYGGFPGDPRFPT